MSLYTLITAGIAVFVIVVFFKTIRIVPQRTAYIVERLGKYSRTLEAGFHILVPFIDRIAYRRSLKEEAVDVPQQVCITKDNVSIGVDGILYLQVVDAQKSCYGIEDYKYAVMQMAQTTMRSVFGTFDLDGTFEAREVINMRVVESVDEASDAWGVKVTRYEIKDIEPPQSIIEAMEKQMKAERDKRAEIAESEGKRQAEINRAEGRRQAMIAESEGEKQKRINEAEGRAQEIERVAEATARGIGKIAQAIQQAGGLQAVNLRIAEQYIQEFGNLARTNNTMIIPATLSDVGGFIAAAKGILDVFDTPAAEPGAATATPPASPVTRWDLPKP
ncbi:MULTISPECIES: SPFH domain-containing protein [Desulfococcus]|uniref:Band 7 protein n=1 Tax=Desulfococcus multivorans DSM 2059 TaxID=1121405 RepID=S7TGK3_DESML|nr:SPFH domain-containing protein [Desulfococcus multivorans]AOY59908.1 inner membrane protein, band 7 family [Desulfococcus multivorans]AQV02061.1 paraslipin [Desulfococcus multivorans]EPR35906.1 band 7 protein [Desulfococcus multivorans DSM 2059]SJZ34881.1 SPFH domain, Band 7 family protein [Desulfococcus multivorans DSM 2059]